MEMTAKACLPLGYPVSLLNYGVHITLIKAGNPIKCAHVVAL